MIYILFDDNEDSPSIREVYQGPTLDIKALRTKFYDKHYHSILGTPQVLVYQGSMKPVDLSTPTFSAGSGYIFPLNSPDTESPEYKEWDKRRKQFWQEWEQKEKQVKESIALRYPGKDLEEMFVSYLKMECGLKDCPYQEI